MYQLRWESDTYHIKSDQSCQLASTFCTKLFGAFDMWSGTGRFGCGRCRALMLTGGILSGLWWSNKRANMPLFNSTGHACESEVQVKTETYLQLERSKQMAFTLLTLRQRGHTRNRKCGGTPAYSLQLVWTSLHTPYGASACKQWSGFESHHPNRSMTCVS